MSFTKGITIEAHRMLNPNYWLPKKTFLQRD